MNPELKMRIDKVRWLIKEGATPGERQAASEALKRILKANGLTEQDIENKEVKVNVRFDDRKNSVIISTQFGSMEINIASLFKKHKR